MKHQRIVRELDRLIHSASSDQTLSASWTGYARVIESMIHLAQHSDDPLVRQTADPLLEVLKGIEEQGAFQSVDFFDKRSDEELDRDIIGRELHFPEGA